MACRLSSHGAPAAFARSHIAAAYFDKMVSVHDPSWLRPIKCELGLVWHRRVLDVRPGSGRLKDALIERLAKSLA